MVPPIAVDTIVKFATHSKTSSVDDVAYFGSEIFMLAS
jgi:hypothetical protein